MRGVLKSVIKMGCAALIGAHGSAAIASNDYPAAPIALVIPYAPGGTTDVVGRIIAVELGKILGQTVVVENRGGAGGVVGTDYVARQKPDGYTLVTGNIGPIATSPFLLDKMPYDPVKDLVPIRNLIGIPNVILVPANSPFQSIEDLLAYQGEPLFYASPGTSTSPHLTGEMFAISTGIPLTHVSYKGSGPALIDLMGGQMQLMFDNLPASISQVQAGSVRALAVTTENRLPALPDVPTLKEAGLDDFVVTGWSGLFAPANTPQPVVDKLYKAVDQVLHDEAVRQRIISLTAEIPESNPQDFATFIQQEMDRWQTVIKKANIVVN
ncbi:tripartite tricarboxylate transporter substrate binding protein [Verticiella sediminum]